jgi:signal peptidase I
MEPTLHCARPAQGCEAYAEDTIVIRQPLAEAHRGDIVVFRTPPLTKRTCGSEGIFVQRVIAVPGDVLGGTRWLRLHRREKAE